jgi:hypothetical protein
MASVQIPESLFMDLVKYHLLGVQEPDIANRIISGLQAKMDKIERHTQYSAVLQQKTQNKQKRSK